MAGVTEQLGSAAAAFPRSACLRLSLDFDALDKADLPWLAGGVHEDASALVGQTMANELARAVAQSTTAAPTGLAMAVLALATAQIDTGGDDLRGQG